MIPFPKWCLQCSEFISKDKRSSNSFICSDCYQQLPFFDLTLCTKCGGQHKTTDCLVPWAIDLDDLQVLYTYDPPLNRWISALKYSRNMMIGRMLQQMTASWLESNQEGLVGVDKVIPVPIHPLRLNGRGFNQAAYLIDKQKHLKVDSSFIRKTKWTVQQTGQTKTERSENLKRSFALRKDPKGLSILVFDDVCTTGQTLSEISKMLKRAGAQRVQALTICRTLVN